MNEFLLEQAKNYFGNIAPTKVVSTASYCQLRDNTEGNRLKTDHE